jgi:cytochrome P450
VTGTKNIPILADDAPEVVVADRAYWEQAERRQSFDLLGERGPVLIHRGEFWITGRAEVLAALRNPAFVKPPPGPAPFRRAINQALTSRAVAAMEGPLREQARATVARVATRGRCEAMSEIAYQFHARALLAFLGLPVYVWEWLIEKISALDENPLESGPRAELFDFLKAHYRRGRLAQLLGGDGGLSGDEVLGCHAPFLFAGFGSTPSAIGWCLYELARDQRSQAKLRDDPVLIPAFIDETLRTQPPIPSIERDTSEALTFDGYSLPELAPVRLHLGAANVEDEQATTAPGHLTFGAGPLRCPASHLALAELKILVSEFLKQLPDFGLAPDLSPQLRGGPVDMLAELPLQWEVR